VLELPLAVSPAVADQAGVESGETAVAQVVGTAADMGARA
jgi:hypothetical protein